MNRVGLLPGLLWATVAFAGLGHVQSCSNLPTAITLNTPAQAGVVFKSDTALHAISYAMHWRDGDIHFLGTGTVALSSPYNQTCTLAVTPVNDDSNYTLDIVCDVGTPLPGDSAAHPLFSFGYEAINAGGDDQFILGCSTDPPTNCDVYATTVQIAG